VSATDVAYERVGITNLGWLLSGDRRRSPPQNEKSRLESGLEQRIIRAQARTVRPSSLRSGAARVGNWQGLTVWRDFPVNLADKSRWTVRSQPESAVEQGNRAVEQGTRAGPGLSGCLTRVIHG
jgi:hypothetical protein